MHQENMFHELFYDFLFPWKPYWNANFWIISLMKYMKFLCFMFHTFYIFFFLFLVFLILSELKKCWILNVLFMFDLWGFGGFSWNFMWTFWGTIYFRGRLLSLLNFRRVFYWNIFNSFDFNRFFKVPWKFDQFWPVRNLGINKLVEIHPLTLLSK